MELLKVTDKSNDRLYEDIFVLLGQVPTDQIIRKVIAECPTALLPVLCDAMRLAVGHFDQSAARRAAALREVIEALENRIARD